MVESGVDLGLVYHNVLTDGDIVALAESAGILVPFEPGMLSGASYDLRVGKVLRSRNRNRMFNLEKDEYSIESGECITFESLECVDFSSEMLFGYVVNKHSVLAKGLVHPITKVDPGFNGTLAVTLFNIGGVAEPIRFGQPIVTLVMVPLGKRPDRLYGVAQKPSFREGSLDIASIVNEPAQPLDDAGLAKMYGRPIARLYELVEDLQKSLDAGLVKADRTEKARQKDIFWRWIVGIGCAILGLAGKILWDHYISH